MQSLCLYLRAFMNIAYEKRRDYVIFLYFKVQENNNTNKISLIRVKSFVISDCLKSTTHRHEQALHSFPAIVLSDPCCRLFAFSPPLCLGSLPKFFYLFMKRATSPYNAHKNIWCEHPEIPSIQLKVSTFTSQSLFQIQCAGVQSFKIYCPDPEHTKITTYVHFSCIFTTKN